MTGKPSQLSMSFALAGLLGLGTVPATLACGFHSMPEVQLEGMYPGSLSVAVALRQAADQGVIDAAALQAPSKRRALYIDAVGRLYAFREAIAVSPAVAELPASFSLGYVESRLWARYSWSDGKLSVDIHTNGPAQGEAVVLTGEPVVTELLAGRLSVEQALANGMILIDGNETEKMAIRHVLDTTSVVSPRISSR
ncbi:MAG TPA: hypothetical protein PKI41_08590 [Candidatus Competibacteraceae bacterium]|nr:MAG: hypothetical protein EKK71_06065 [Candidatus Competibacteraceae bacterium]HOB62169.1 hypothetical protein [Candidatus Competibacteraceae bacterium]HQD55061.1 hypothetical protein [Candidatus Competibacteraceae bacterium]